MYSSRTKLIDFRRLAVFGLLLVCFTEVIVAQTFNYSRGWTNGKRGSPMLSGTGERSNEPESSDILQMQRLKRLIELSHCMEQNESGEIPEKADDYFNYLKRYVGLGRLAYLNTWPRLKM